MTDSRLRGMIGAPLTRIFSDLLSGEDQALLDRAVTAYRIRFNEVGIFENALYPGVAEALELLCRTGHTLQIVTAKPAVSAWRVAAHFGIAGFFHAVHGPELAARDCDTRRPWLVRRCRSPAANPGWRWSVTGPLTSPPRAFTAFVPSPRMGLRIT